MFWKFCKTLKEAIYHLYFLILDLKFFILSIIFNSQISFILLVNGTKTPNSIWEHKSQHKQCLFNKQF